MCLINRELSLYIYNIQVSADIDSTVLLNLRLGTGHDELNFVI